MDGKYLIVDRSILPDYFDKVVEACELLRSGAAKDVSEAVKRVGISRSTYYKYKDRVLRLTKEQNNRKAILSVMLRHESGRLETMLRICAGFDYNIWTINQSPPVGGQAQVILVLDMSEAKAPVETLMQEIQGMNGAREVALIGIE